MEILEQRQGAVTVLKPRGPLVGMAAEEFGGQAVLAINKTLGRIVIDAQGIPYVDSRGLESLVEVSKHLAESGQALRLVNVNDTIHEVLELTDLAGEFEFHVDLNTAVRSFL